MINEKILTVWPNEIFPNKKIKKNTHRCVSLHSDVGVDCEQVLQHVEEIHNGPVERKFDCEI